MNSFGKVRTPNQKLSVERGLLHKRTIRGENIAVHHDDVREELPKERTAQEIQKEVRRRLSHYFFRSARALAHVQEDAEDEIVDRARQNGNDKRPQKAQGRGVVFKFEVFRDQDANLVLFKECILF